MSPFKGLLRDPRDVAAPEGSINAALLALPQQRKHTHDMQGRVLYFPRTGIIGVPFDLHRGGSWSVVVVDGSFGPRRDGGREMYPRGGHHIDVSDLEMQTAVELGPVRRTEERGFVRPGGTLLHRTFNPMLNKLFERFSMSTPRLEVLDH